MIESRIMILFEEQGFDLIHLKNVWFDLDLIWNFVIWFKIIPNPRRARLSTKTVEALLFKMENDD